MKGSSATTIKSIQNYKAELTKFIKTLEEKPNEILQQEATQIYREAFQETPKKSGKLEKSVYVKVAKDKRRPGFNIGASARNRNYNYAGIQHENMLYRHPIKGKAKYLEDPFERGIRRIYRRFDKEIKL